MKSYTANRLSSGNKLFPAEIKIDNYGVTLRVPGLFSGKEKSLSFDKISSVRLDNPMIGFSTILFDTIGHDRIKAMGFEKSDAQEKYENENHVFSAFIGGKLLRFTAEMVTVMEFKRQPPLMRREKLL